MESTLSERAIAGEVTCQYCKHVWFGLIPEIAEPPYACPKCNHSEAYCHTVWKLYCSVKESPDKSTIWVEGYSRVFEADTLWGAAELLKKAMIALCAGDTSLLER